MGDYRYHPRHMRDCMGGIRARSIGGRLMPLTIITNNVTRDLLCFEDLTDDERAEFDYVNAADFCSPRFFRYRGCCYDLNDGFDSLPTYTPGVFRDNLKGWDGFQSDSFFSGIAVRFPRENGEPDFERIIVALVYS